MEAVVETARGRSLRVRSVSGLQLVLIGVMLLGVVLVGVGIKSLVDTRRFLTTAEVAQGVVVRVEINTLDRMNERVFVEFVTAREQVAQFVADDGSLQVGESVRLLYDPANPENARLDNWGNRWAGFLAPTGAGLILVVLNGLVYWWTRRGGPPNRR
jgi:Protein of unknown function (DUF3592)